MPKVKLTEAEVAGQSVVTTTSGERSSSYARAATILVANSIKILSYGTGKIYRSSWIMWMETQNTIVRRIYSCCVPTVTPSYSREAD